MEAYKRMQLHFNDIRWRWGKSSKSRQLYCSGSMPSIHFVWDWVGPSAGMEF
jgi:hypothetical protein